MNNSIVLLVIMIGIVIGVGSCGAMMHYQEGLSDRKAMELGYEQRRIDDRYVYTKVLNEQKDSSVLQ